MFVRAVTQGTVVDLGHEHGRRQGRIRVLWLLADGSAHLRFDDHTTIDIPSLKGAA